MEKSLKIEYLKAIKKSELFGLYKVKNNSTTITMDLHELQKEGLVSGFSVRVENNVLTSSFSDISLTEKGIDLLKSES